MSKTVTSSDTLTLESSKTQTVSNSLTLEGSTGNLLSLRSSTSGTQANLTLQSGGSQSLSFLDVKDINASGGQTLSPSDVTNSGNNTGWSFNSSPGGGEGGGAGSGGGTGGGASPTPAPTATPMPTAMPTPVPTATPVPIATPTPVAKPSAAFSANPVVGKAPLITQFIDNSTGVINSWLWDFGDNSTSSEKAPLHIYLKEGKYSVSLTVTGPGGIDTIKKTGFVIVLSKESLVAEFSALPKEGRVPLVVRFNDLTTGGVPQSWLWDFGDESTDSEQNPTHTYNKVGSYTVSLTVSGSNGSNTNEKSNFIKVVPIDASLSDFIVISKSGFSPLTAQFIEQTKGEIVLCLWDCGDGDTSSEHNHSHTYTTVGKFDVSLTVEGPGGKDVKVKQGVIEVLSEESLITDFTANSKQGHTPFKTQFIDLSSDSFDEWQWSFGDSEISSERNPSHTYTNAGNYTVTLTTKGEKGSGAIVKEEFIKVVAPHIPVANFSSGTRKGFVPVEVQFFNKSFLGGTNVINSDSRDHGLNIVKGLAEGDEENDGIVSILWDFGDGETNNENDPLHTYTKEGNYTVTLTVEGKDGFTTVKDENDMIAVIPADKAMLSDFDATPTSGRIPLEVQFRDLSFGDDIVGWLWNFGDGKTSEEVSPTHIYDNAGIYSVSLEVKDSTGKADLSDKRDFITVLPSEGPVADFIHLGTKGVVPFTVKFVDNSSGDITERVWDFGDSNSSVEKDPEHTYTKAGVYSVKLTVSGPGGVDFIEKREIIVVGVQADIKADFIGAMVRGEVPLTTQFSDLSSGNVESWLWEFGDGNTANEQNPSHTYKIPGIFNVSLSVSISIGETLIVKEGLIKALKKDKVFADFETLDNSKGFVPFKVQFVDTSLGTVKEWLWNFGDGGTSAEKDPEYTYGEVGKYTVTLNVESDNDGDTNIETNFIEVLEKGTPLAEFDAEPVKGFNPATIEFVDKSEGDDVEEWLWDFDDGETSRKQNPTHIYNSAGHFTVKLFISSQSGTSVNEKEDFITIVEEDGILVKFEVDRKVGVAPLTVQFTDLSEGQNIDGWLWDFDDGTTSNEQNPVHTFKNPGFYTATLIVSGAKKASFESQPFLIKVLPADSVKAEFSADPVSGIAPVEVTFRDRSEGNITNWFWDFGDGATSNLQNPSHIYSNDGFYTVSLTVSGLSGTNSEEKRNFIKVNRFEIKATAEPDTILSGERGDIDITTEDVVYTYSAPGLYSVTFDIETKDGTKSSKTRIDYIDVNVEEDKGIWPLFKQNKQREGRGTYLVDNDNIGLLWVFEAGDWVDSSPVIADDGTIYVGSYDKNLYALNKW